MPEQKNPDAEKIIKRQKRVIIFLTSLILFSVLYLLIVTYLNGELFAGPGPDPTVNAGEKVNKFRNSLTLRRKKAHGVWYDIDKFQRYIDTFPKLIEKTASDGVNNRTISIEGLEWKISFYWMLVKDDDGILKHDFCMVPTLVSTTNDRDVKDYFDPDNDKYYNHKNDLTGKYNILGALAPYDEGQLWP